MFGSNVISSSGNFPFKGWRNRATINVDAFKSLNFFTILIDELNVPANFFSVVENGGGDIRCSLDSLGYDRVGIEVVECNTSTNKLVVWVFVGSISSVVDTPIYLFYGKSGEAQPLASSPFGSESAWTGTFKTVQHMNDTSGNLLDSSSNGNDAVSNGTLPNPVTGKVGTGQEFNGSTDYGDFPDVGSYDRASVQAWIKLNTVSSGRKAIVSFDNFGNGQPHFRTDDTSLEIDPNGGGNGSFNLPLVTGVWYHVGYSYIRNDRVDVYLDGVFRFTISMGDFPWDGTFDYTIGREQGGRHFDGVMDEVRTANSTRSADFMEATYVNQNLTTDFLTLASSI